MNGSMNVGPLTPDERRWRLGVLAGQWGIGDLPPPQTLSRPLPSPLSPSFANPSSNDEYMAEELLKRRRINASQSQQPQGGIKRAFTTNKKKGWEPKEIFDALDSHVANGGSPGVAEALIAKLRSAGGDVNMSSMKSRTNLLTRRRSLESFERSRILQKAIENQQPDMVGVLVPHADPLTLDGSLPLAIRSGNLAITQLLLSHGANASQTADGQDAFRQACHAGGQAELVAHLLASDGRPPPSWVSQSMVGASRRGCLDTVLRLSRSTADGSYDNAAALKHAVAQCRGDITLAILTGAKPPVGQGLNEAFSQLFSHATIMPNEKLALAEMLLCAGAQGDVVSDALLQSAVTEFFDMVDLLIAHGASIEYQDAKVLRAAISHGRASLVHLLLNERSALSPIYASECVECIPKRISPEDRHALMSLLLRKGAGGEPLSDALISAVEAGDLETAKLLLTPHFPGGRLVESHDLRKGPRGMVYDRHETASVDHRGGLALQVGAMTGNLAAVKLILSAKPAPETLAEVFPNLMTLSPVDRYRMMECFLATTGLPGQIVSKAMQQAIDERPPRRDERLISLLLSHNADVNFNDGAGIISAVAHEDVTLLERLLQSKPSSRTAAAALSKAMLNSNLPIRLRMISALLGAGAGLEGKEVAEAMIIVLQEKPMDMDLLGVLLKQGHADINFNLGAPFILAVRDPNPQVVELLLQNGKPSQETIERGLQKLAELASTPEKARKMDAILPKMEKKALITSLLVAEVQAALATRPEQRVLSVVRTLLSSGADVNAYKAAALCRAVAAADTQVADLLFAARPVAASLAAALPSALHIADPMDRLTFAQRLLEAGAPAAEANRALVHAVNTYPDDLPLIGLLASSADGADGEALAWAVRLGRVDIVELVLAKGTAAKRCPAPDVLGGVLAEAMKLQDRDRRKEACELLLRAGACGPAVSDALLAAASDGDLALGTALVNAGAAVDHRDGQAVVEACRAGADDVLRMLLSSPAEVAGLTLTRGFQASTEVGDLQRRCAVFELLLERGVSGDVADAQLVSAARYGDEGIELVRLLLRWGCSPDHNSGEAIWTATRSAFLGSLKAMLGVEDVGGKQRRPSRATLVRSLKASWRLSPGPRLEVIEMLFKAGLPRASEEVHVGLTKAVADERPDMRLVRLLLDHGASPLANGCQALSDAARRLLSPVLDAFLQGEVPAVDVSWAFSQAFTADGADAWMSDAGLGVARQLLAKGAGGDGVTAALVIAVEFFRTERDGIARRFVDLLLSSGSVDVNFGAGALLQKAAKQADADLIQKLLERKPSSEAVSLAFPYIFELELPEEEALRLISLFGEYRNGEDRLDVMFNHPECQPVVFRALSQYPRSTSIVQALLDAGYYFDRMTTARVMDEIEEDEQVSLLFWALMQPQKKISSAVLGLLLEKGAKVNFETSISKTTPLMLAVQHRRPDVVRALILAGAEVDVADATGNTPLTMATRVGGEVGTAMMTSVLAAEPSRNDGSLHNAARELDLAALRLLADFGHDVDFPSPLHGGRSALGEMCLHAADSPLTAVREKAMARAMSFLMEERGTDLTLRSDGKSVLLLALGSRDPVPTARALLRAGMWRHVNEPFNRYSDGRFTYSPTEYVARLMTASDAQEQLLSLLRANRAEDVFYANEGPQPEGASGLPEELLRAERERKARAERLALEDRDHERQLGRAAELAGLQDRIYAERAALEEARSRRLHDDELSAMRSRAAVEGELFSEAVRRQRAEREAALEHTRGLAEAELSRLRLLAESELEAEELRRSRLLEWERKTGEERLASAQQLSAVRVREREDLDRVDRESDARVRTRLAEQKKLVDSQNALAGRLAGVGVNGRRQIGYITGELD